MNEKVDALNVKIQELKESVAARESPARKRNAKPTKRADVLVTLALEPRCLERLEDRFGGICSAG